MYIIKRESSIISVLHGIKVHSFSWCNERASCSPSMVCANLHLWESLHRKGTCISDSMETSTKYELSMGGSIFLPGWLVPGEILTSFRAMETSVCVGWLIPTPARVFVAFHTIGSMHRIAPSHSIVFHRCMTSHVGLHRLVPSHSIVFHRCMTPFVGLHRLVPCP